MTAPNQGFIAAEELMPIMMDYIKADYYVALLSAASFYGATHQKAAKFQIISNQIIKHNLKFSQVEIELLYKKSLKGLPTEKREVATGYLNVASPELVAIDLFKYRNQSGGLNHIATVLSELVEVIDPRKLIELASTLKEKGILQRMGYILEKIEHMDQTKADKIIAAMAEFLASQKTFYLSLAPELPKQGHPYIKQWKIIANTEIESDL